MRWSSGPARATIVSSPSSVAPNRRSNPPAGAADLALAALGAAPVAPAYARVDLLRDNDGRLAIIELELIEPALWLELAPDRGASFAAAIVSAATAARDRARQ